MNFENNLWSNHESLKMSAFRLTNDKHAADDLVQETFLTALQNRDKYQEGTNLAGWLATIQRNIFINAHRKNERVKIAKRRAPHYDHTVENEFAVEANADRIERAVLMLPGKYRDTIDMIADDAPYAEIALAMCEPIGTIKSRVHHGRKLLKKMIL